MPEIGQLVAVLLLLGITTWPLRTMTDTKSLALFLTVGLTVCGVGLILYCFWRGSRVVADVRNHVTVDKLRDIEALQVRRDNLRRAAAKMEAVRKASAANRAGTKTTGGEKCRASFSPE